MRKSLIFKGLVLTTLVLTFMVQSCKKDDGLPSRNKVMNIDNTKYALSSAVIRYYGIASYSMYTYTFFIHLTGDGLQFDPVTGNYSGHGAGLVFELLSSLETDILPGTYTYDPDAILAPFTFDLGIVFTDYDTDNETYNLRNVGDGTVTVSKSNSVYTITFDCTLDGGETLTGTYKSEIEIIDKRSTKKDLSRIFHSYVF